MTTRGKHPNGVQPQRLSEEAPRAGDAIVRSAWNKNMQRVAETTTPAARRVTTMADEVFFATIGAAAATWSLLTQSGAVGTANPSYAQSVISTNYSITCSVSDANRASYAGQGTGAITRAEA